ncbi:hypothetical protein L198_07291 [Cryptococcus wingfieldii CBS 7118]|uniref:Uncharacterized protein n=1 Tax=Cryptococcus wingfieldii CBS 7118 TaxID=1295528 RepID=A0A1E3IFB2_9TREE|nr:hypothetical protein L198_07291 [Cryptococcus wingfieldii CBS 7118]ODN86596.1 hypothetical protein L198_07291 [Cryptococcus wingfieldii CBS 7118]
MTEADPSSPPRLPEDVMYLLLGHLGATTSPSALTTFLRVSRYFHKRLIPFLYTSPMLTQRNNFGFFYPLYYDDHKIDDDEREEWWQGDLEDKKSAVARRLPMLGYVQCVSFEDDVTAGMCNSAVDGFLAQGLDSPPREWYGYPCSSQDDSSPARRHLFYGRAFTHLHLSHKFLGGLRLYLKPENESRRVQTFQSMLGPFGVLSIQQPESLRGLHGYFVPHCLRPICIRAKPLVLVINDYDDIKLAYILSPSQRGIAMRLWGSVNTRSNAQTDEVVEFLSSHMKITHEPLFYIIYNFSMDEACYDHCNGKQVRDLILNRAFAAASQSPKERIVRLEIIMQGPQSNAATVESMRSDIFELMKKG